MKDIKKFKLTQDIIDACLEESFERIVVNNNKSCKQK